MKLFLDTADIPSITKWINKGIIDGITTNPTLLSKEDSDPTVGVQKIAQLLGERDVSVEVTETDPDAIYQQAKKIASLATNIVVKIPCCVDYYHVIQKLVQEGIALNITLVFSVFQGFAMCKLGVKYISPFIGRLDDIDEDGMYLVHELRIVIDQYEYQTQLLAASLRSVSHLHDVLIAGADVATVTIAVLEKAVKHPLTDAGMKKFLDDWHKLGVKKFP